MISGSLARRYARAILAIGREQNAIERLGQEVDTLANIIHDSAELRETLSNPAFPRQERRKVVASILERMNASKPMQNFTALLLDRDRLSILPSVSRELSAMIDEAMGRVSATVTSAQALSTDQIARITNCLANLSGKQVTIETREDASLLGGIVAQVGDIVYDHSLRTQLHLLRENSAITEGA